MICEPYICTKGPRAGEIEWMDVRWTEEQDAGGKISGITWIPYADFEREKVRILSIGSIRTLEYSVEGCRTRYAYVIDNGSGHRHESFDLIGYGWDDYMEGSESSRLLKRAEFLKAVCEKEGIEWLSCQSCTTNYYGLCDRCMTAALHGLYESFQRAMCKCECKKTACPCGRH
jgi:hypothetical protein